ncbi:hybrid sensor histidine kinase/response regulator [Biformimicrobium ophioploci]|uniref:histidine kinase n=1 Tax=Biformimicrobium ophioploci TaxID=3036711 RepID=A0ABQ6M0Q6_9GAMM|nr:PAS-domain containing protein [Microbulbifer sp. NKW57]GMG87929.1 PAS domain-containing hybrid sensor histidine kinase/response regulator [Microbulbifer sp. NKW57]
MFSIVSLALVALAYLLLLFAVAFWGDRVRPHKLKRFKPYLLALAGTYTSAWMFFGTPAQAVEEGWIIPPTFLGACLVLLFGAPLLQRLVRLSKQQGSTSIADFISAQFGGSPVLAASVALIAMVAVLPYLALQLRAVADSFQLLADSPDTHAPMLTAVVSLTLGLFALLFGTRHIDSGEHRNGMLLAVALEALVKIGAFVAVAWFALYNGFNGAGELAREALSSERVEALRSARPADTGFLAAVVLGMAAMFCLPRQFHILMIESDSDKDISIVRKLIPLYLGILAAAILAVGYGGLIELPSSYTNPERFVLALPIEGGKDWLAMLAFIGGLSAGSSMVIIATIALSTMISNTMVVPWWLRQLQIQPGRQPLGQDLLKVRRLIIAAIMIAAFLVNELIGPDVRLGTFGLLSLALVAQLAPAMLAAGYWPKRHKRPTACGIIAGLITGAAIWGCYSLPAALGMEALLPFPLASWNHLTITGFFGLSVNIGVALLVSVAERRWRPEADGNASTTSDRASLHQLLARFIGSEAASRTFAKIREQGQSSTQQAEAYRHTAEKVLAGIVGSASARRLLAQLGEPGADRFGVDAASEIYQFGRGMLQSSIDNIDQGISVVDANLNLVAWNRRYIELFNYPQEMIYVGQPVAELVRFNALRGEFGGESIEESVDKRVAHLRRGTCYKVRRHRKDGTVLEIRGNPLPDGGFVTTYTDVSEFVHTLDELEDIKSRLEEKVAGRTAELESLNEDLKEAIASKTRFLAAASHDLVQPLNASGLFLDALGARDLDDASRKLVERTSGALHAAEQLITDILQLARIDAGDIRPAPIAVDLQQLLGALATEVGLRAEKKGLELRVRCPKLWVRADENMLRRVVQNLLENAVKYTETGGVLLAARRRKGRISIEVWDTGVGIARDQQQEVFREFSRFSNSAGGYGLGLATVERLCRLMQAPLQLHSRPGHGSVFSLSLQRSVAAFRNNVNRSGSAGGKAALDLKVLSIDNEPSVLEAMQTLLESWGCRVSTSTGYSTAFGHATPDILLVDYHLDNGDNGIDLASALFEHWDEVCPCVVISAENTDAVRKLAQSRGFSFLQKPVRPAALRALLRSTQTREAATT